MADTEIYLCSSAPCQEGEQGDSRASLKPCPSHDERGGTSVAAPVGRPPVSRAFAASTLAHEPTKDRPGDAGWFDSLLLVIFLFLLIGAGIAAVLWFLGRL